MTPRLSHQQVTGQALGKHQLECKILVRANTTMGRAEPVEAQAAYTRLQQLLQSIGEAVRRIPCCTAWKETH